LLTRLDTGRMRNLLSAADRSDSVPPVPAKGQGREVNRPGCDCATSALPVSFMH
jgi:hypothetical protein